MAYYDNFNLLNAPQPASFTSDYPTMNDDSYYDDPSMKAGALDYWNSVNGATTEEDPYSLDGIQQGYADMLRSDYDDWEERFQPFEDLYRNKLLDPVEHSAMDSESMGFVDRGVNNAYQRSLAQLNKQDRMYGQQLDADEQASRSRRLLLSKGAALSKGRTDMSTYLGNRNLQLLAGGL